MQSVNPAARPAGRSPVIARVWHGVTPAVKADAYADYLAQTGVRDCLATPGNRGVQVWRRLEGERAEFVFVSYWESLDMIRPFAGEEIERARYYPEDAHYLLALEPTVSHYELVTSVTSPTSLGGAI